MIQLQKENWQLLSSGTREEVGGGKNLCALLCENKEAYNLACFNLYVTLNTTFGM